MTIFIVLPQIEGVTLLLGGWWLEAAKRGGPDTLPVINLSPEVKRERALSLSLELLFIHTSFCLMSDYLMYVLSSLLHMSAELMVTRGTKAWKLCYKVFFFWKWSKKGFIRNVRRIQLCENDSISNSLKRQKMKIQDIFIQSDRLFSFQELRWERIISFVCGKLNHMVVAHNTKRQRTNCANFGPKYSHRYCTLLVYLKWFSIYG